MKEVSKKLSLVLRHYPDFIGIELDTEGWALVADLIEGFRVKGINIDGDLLDKIVSENDKKRFTYNSDKTKIRANQGHSVSIDLKLLPKEPPFVLYHGTVDKFMKSIREKGLLKMSRQHVHLSSDLSTAQLVGSRRGAPLILKVNAKKMFLDGFEFFISENGVWLTDHVPFQYIFTD